MGNSQPRLHATYVTHALNFNAQTPGKKAEVVPGGLALINLKKAVESGKVPGMTNFFSSNFEDDLHVNMNGRYFIGLVTFASLYSQNPVGLPVVKINDKPPTLTPAQNKVYQQVAWDTVQSFRKDGGASLGFAVPGEIDARAYINNHPIYYNDPLVRYISAKRDITYLLTAPTAGKYELKVNMIASKPNETLEVFLNNQKAGSITPNLNGCKAFHRLAHLWRSISKAGAERFAPLRPDGASRTKSIPSRLHRLAAV
jgi:hypothetical protein